MRKLKVGSKVKIKRPSDPRVDGQIGVVEWYFESFGSHYFVVVDLPEIEIHSYYSPDELERV